MRSGEATHGGGRSTHLVWLVLGLVLVGLVMRSPLSSVGPILPGISEDLGLSPTIAGLSGTIPLVGFSLLALLTPFLVARLGPERTLGGALVVLTLAIVVRSAGTTAAFFGGTALAATGIAVANVVLPSVVRERFPGRVPTLSSMNVVVMNVGAAVASAVSLPLARDTWLGWTGALAIWAIPSLVALAGWTRAARAGLADDHGTSRVRTPPTGMGRVARRPVTWLLAVMFGAQSAGFYTLLTWLATILRDHGVDPATAGLLVGLLSALGIIGALGVGPFLQRGHQRVTFVAAVGLYTLALLLLGVSAPLAIAGTLLAGVVQGACFSIVLTLISHRDDPADVPATSALVQGVGYVIAGTAPFAAGALYELTGSWWPPVLFVAGLMATSGALGAVVTRPSS